MAEGGERFRGTVKWFNGWKGFGFITPDNGNSDEDIEELFVHQTSIKSDGFRTLREGQRVEFSVLTSEDGRSSAADVIPLRERRVVTSGGGGADVECYNCGRYGHFARDCFRSQRRERGRGRGGRGGARGGYGYDDGEGRGYGRGRGGGRGGYYGYGRRGGGRGCYNCGEEGHFARDCQNVQE